MQRDWKDEILQITGIVQNNKHKMLAINGMPDRVHILFRFRPSQSLSDLMQDIKGSSSSGSTKKDLLKESFHGRSAIGQLCPQAGRIWRFFIQ